MWQGEQSEGMVHERSPESHKVWWEKLDSPGLNPLSFVDRKPRVGDTMSFYHYAFPVQMMAVCCMKGTRSTVIEQMNECPSTRNHGKCSNQLVFSGNYVISIFYAQYSTSPCDRMNVTVAYFPMACNCIYGNCNVSSAKQT